MKVRRMGKVVGPGAVQAQDTDIRPTLEGVSEFEYVSVLNPLPDDFAVRVAQDIPVNMPVTIGKDTSGKTTRATNTDQDVRQIYGLDLKNPEFQGRKHITNDTVIPAGETRNFKGNEAQVAVRQLVNEIAQREGNKRLLADPSIRKSIEDKIIKGRGSIQDLMDSRLQSTRTQLDDAINHSNEDKDEAAFPELDQANPGPGTGSTYTPNGDGNQPKRVGRPKKTDS